MDSAHSSDTTVGQFLGALRKAAGEEGVRAVLSAKGGTTVTVPRFGTATHWLTKLIGLAATEQVCAELRVFDVEGRAIGGGRFRLPLGSHSGFHKRAQAVEQLLMEGRSVRAVALAIGIAERAVFTHRARLVKAGKLKKGGGQ